LKVYFLQFYTFPRGGEKMLQFSNTFHATQYIFPWGRVNSFPVLKLISCNATHSDMTYDMLNVHVNVV
jgi:hypothetical protein